MENRRTYHGSCHCGAVKFRISSPEISSGVRCNCSICQRKGALMTPYIYSPEELVIEAGAEQLSVYQFGTGVAKHYFCKVCGMYPFHQTLRKAGYYRANIGCLQNLDPLALPQDIFDGKAL
ncbi:GFA family protein [Chitinibacter sp. ZOR0017]|uniref:GFA family protein n=1 Tax=Chitinibacter sp. ZOR0017 TaxID=1339254 RepID=UPI00064902F3|nr:GFA family protein [Chitinibacter sp. ZOR0017]